MNYYQRALELKEETIKNRRYIHQRAEVGLDLPVTKQFIKNKLTEYHIEPQDCGYGITATIGSGKPVILIRADMDALPMSEESGLDFACPTLKQAHACGHDLHSAMLLTAARMLKENENNLNGTVKLMFQPAEETFEGCLNMIENGILENPKVDVAMACHIDADQKVGTIAYNATEAMMNSVDVFEIDIKGKGAHGAYPHLSVDPINIGVHIYMALQSLIAREATPSKSCVLTIGKFEAGTAPNIIPDTAILKGTIRTNDILNRSLLVNRMKEIAHKEAELFNGQASVNMISSIPPLINDFDFTNKMISYMKELDIENVCFKHPYYAQASEDFALICEKVPTIYFSVGAKNENEKQYPLHNPKVILNEDVCPIGAACLAHSAQQWLQDFKK